MFDIFARPEHEHIIHIVWPAGMIWIQTRKPLFALRLYEPRMGVFLK